MGVAARLAQDPRGKISSTESDGREIGCASRPLHGWLLAIERDAVFRNQDRLPVRRPTTESDLNARVENAGYALHVDQRASAVGAYDHDARDDVAAPEADQRPKDVVSAEDDRLAEAESLIGHANIERRDRPECDARLRRGARETARVIDAVAQIVGRGALAREERDPGHDGVHAAA
jgi:hypothetical protein